MLEDTIVAIATPPGKAGVAIIRISGEKSKQILQKFTQEQIDYKPRYMYYKDITFNSITDNALVVYFQAPNSYTGEDVVEIQCHGGYFVAQEVLKQALCFGARIANPGEFSKRAFLNGKMTIDQAEGVMDIINAESESQARAGSELINGELKSKIVEIQDRLTEIIASIEARLDYPEYDFDDSEVSLIENDMISIKNELKMLIDSHIKGNLIKNGIKIAIIGKPNVGKSSLLNALTHSQKAIVTNIAGTTRDVIEAEYTYNGLIFRLFDTAGLHESDDIVEKIGIERAKNIIKQADIILKLVEVGEEIEVDTFNKPTITVYTKSDLHNLDKLKIKSGNCVSVSTIKNENIEVLKQMIYEQTISNDYDSNKFYLTNTRHVENVKKALEALLRAIDGLKTNTFDMEIADLRISWQALGEITGNSSNEEIIDKIFSKFCLGK